MAKETYPWVQRPIDKVRDRKFYCYVLMDPRKPGPFAFGDMIFPCEPFYIGKGTGYRLHAHFTEAKRYRKDGKLPNDTEYAKITRILEIMDSGIPEKLFKETCAKKVVECVNEFESFEWETRLITAIGRVARRMGPLVNENDGTQFTGGYQSVVAPGYTGMNNMTDGADAISDAKNPAIAPRVILNADVDTRGRLTKRQGFRPLVNLPGAKSIWSCPKHGVFVCAPANDSALHLYRIRGERAVDIGAVSNDTSSDVFAVDIDTHIMIATKSSLFYYDPIYGTFERNLVPPAATPVAVKAPGVGSLAPGRYFYCFTRSHNGLVGAPGSYGAIDIGEENCGVAFLNADIDTTIWMTDADGEVFFRCLDHVAPHGEFIGQRVVTHHDEVEPLPTFQCVEMPNCTVPVLAFGRLWGADGNRLIYSESYRYDLFRETNFMKFPEEITMIAAASVGTLGGLYVGLKSRTVFVAAPATENMSQRNACAAPVFGTLAYCQNMPELGNYVPVWVTPEGIMAGKPDGTTVNLTINKVRLNPGLKGASFFRMYNGSPQLVSSCSRPDFAQVGFGDSATCEVIRNGKVL